MAFEEDIQLMTDEATDVALLTAPLFVDTDLSLPLVAMVEAEPILTIAAGEEPLRRIAG